MAMSVTTGSRIFASAFGQGPGAEWERRPQPGTILMGHPPLLLLRELPQLLPISAVDNPD